MSTVGTFANDIRNTPAILTFSKTDHKVPYKHNKLLYVTTMVNGVEFKRAFLYRGASINAMTYLVFTVSIGQIFLQLASKVCNLH